MHELFLGAQPIRFACRYHQGRLNWKHWEIMLWLTNTSLVACFSCVHANLGFTRCYCRRYVYKITPCRSSPRYRRGEWRRCCSWRSHMSHSSDIDTSLANASSILDSFLIIPFHQLLHFLSFMATLCFLFCYSHVLMEFVLAF